MSGELLIGCGQSREKRVSLGNPEWMNLVTLDINPDAKPDILHDLEVIPYPLGESFYDEIHAYEVLEHVGRQGDWRFFFKQFDEFARILKPNGTMFITSPRAGSNWVWGDPGHTRYMGPQVYCFLDRAEYDTQLGKTAMTDYRRCFTSNWERLYIQEQGESIVVVLRNIKAK
jgi:hypothetical protein